MKIIYEFEVPGFDDVPHPKAFFEAWLQEGVQKLFERAREIAISGGQRSYTGLPVHSVAPGPGWEYLGCLGKWHSGDVYEADSHCLEVFRSPDDRIFLVDQSEHGCANFGHSYNTEIVAEVPRDN